MSISIDHLYARDETRRDLNEKQQPANYALLTNSSIGIGICGTRASGYNRAMVLRRATHGCPSTKYGAKLHDVLLQNPPWTDSRLPRVSRRAAGRGCLSGGSSEGRPGQQPGSGVYRPGRWFIASDLDIERDRLCGGLDGERQGGLARLRLIGHFPSRVPDHVPAQGPTVSCPRPGGHRHGDSRSGRRYELASRQRLLALLLPLQTGRSFFEEKDALS